MHVAVLVFLWAVLTAGCCWVATFLLHREREWLDDMEALGRCSHRAAQTSGDRGLAAHAPGPRTHLEEGP